MSKKEFDEFLEKVAQNNKPAGDREEETIDWFKGQLKILFDNVETWLKEYVDEEKIILEYKDLEIYEESLGSYMVKRLKIVIGSKTAELIPIGTVLIGTAGRADLSSGVETIRFILADRNATGPNFVSSIFESEEELLKFEEGENNKSKPQIDWTWKITSNPPHIKYSELNQDSFLDCLKGVIDG